MRPTLILVTAALLSSCAFMASEERFPKGMSDEVVRSTRRTAESHTLSRMAALERSLNDYIQAKGKIPDKLTELVPEYIGEIPEAELGIKEHKDTEETRYYPPSVIVGGGINGSALGDSGGWGYAFNERQVIVFVDCTHQRMDGSLWYKTRGVY
ncbi:MAG: hypothetical protein HYZ75_19655 [Elusimicrobia bacterium]|nr:hypothetical protein [Elusimicrobiota bacterium]